jgi:hypothetical protein
MLQTLLSRILAGLSSRLSIRMLGAASAKGMGMKTDKSFHGNTPDSIYPLHYTWDALLE